MRPGTETTNSGFTLPEVLVCLVILALLAGIVHAALAPARERARAASCLNNLSQISKAIRMYRDDYGGQDPPGALTCSQLGLPAEPRLLMPYLGHNWRVFYCPSEYWGPGGPPPMRSLRPDQMSPWNRRNPISYMWQIHPEDYPQSPELKTFGATVALRGEEAPLVIDPHHGPFWYGQMRNVRFLVVRLGGQVQDEVVRRVGSAYGL